MSLVRLRANPRKIRVAIRRRGNRWLCTVSDPTKSRFLRCTGRDPVATVARAIWAAQSGGLDGVDLDMQWTYQHPKSTEDGNGGVVEVLTC